MLAVAGAALAVIATCKAVAFEAIEPHPNTAAQAESFADMPEPADWGAIDWHPGTEPASDSVQPPGTRPRWTMPTPKSAPATSWNRTEKADGAADVTVKRALPLGWDSQVGADFNLAAPPRDVPGPVNPAALLPGTASDPSAGAAWALVSTPALDTPLGSDKAAIDARLDSTQELGKVGVSASKSVAFGRQLSLTLKGGYAATETFAHSAGAPLPASPWGGSRVYTTEHLATLTILPTQTAVAAGRTMSTVGERWLHTLSAEQTLFAGASVVGSVSESPEGPLNTSIVAKYRRLW